MGGTLVSAEDSARTMGYVVPPVTTTTAPSDSLSAAAPESHLLGTPLSPVTQSPN
jgi:hypothetical protein